MRKIAIIGSGQAGLLAAHGLLKAGYAVTLYSDRTADKWLNESRPTGTAGRFDLSLEYERELGLNFWDKAALGFEGVYLVFSLQAAVPFITMSGLFEKRGLAIDLRLQSHRWMNEFEARGGELHVETVDVARLDEIAGKHDLTLVATGRGSLTDLFPRDAQRSVYDTPQRHLAMVITTGASMDFEAIPFRPVKFNFLGPAGEAFWIPYFHKTHGPTWNLLFEAKPGGPLDKFEGAKSGEEVLHTVKQLIQEFFPWDTEWAKDMQLADEYGWLVGKFAPTVRKPVGCLPSGRVVMPLGDTAMTFDPITGQGANNGNKMARHVVNAIVAQGDQAFDAAWMEATFEAYYHDQGKATYDFTNLFLEPLTSAGQEILIAQYGSNGRKENRGGQQAIANAICQNFVDPRLMTGAFLDMGQARTLIQQKTGRAWWRSAVRGRAAVIRDQIRQKLGFKPAVGYW